MSKQQGQITIVNTITLKAETPNKLKLRFGALIRNWCKCHFAVGNSYCFHQSLFMFIQGYALLMSHPIYKEEQVLINIELIRRYTIHNIMLYDVGVHIKLNLSENEVQIYYETQIKYMGK